MPDAAGFARALSEREVRNSTKRSRWSEIIISGALLLVACNFALNIARDGQYFFPIESYTHLDVKLPYQYRILMVPVFRLLNSFFEIANFQRYFAHLPPYLATSGALSYFTVNSFSFFVATQAFRRIAFDVFQSTGLTACAVFLFVVIAYLAFVLNPNLNLIFPYDLPSLAFVQLGTLCIIRGWWKTLIGLFAIATVNRETTFLLVIFLLLGWWFHQRKERNSALRVAAVLVAIWLAIKLSLFLTVTGSGSDGSVGGLFALKLVSNFAELLKPWQWPSLLPNFLPLAILAALLSTRLKSHREWHLTAVVGYAVLFPVAQVAEFRAFGDLIGFLAMSLTLILRERSVIPCEVK